jgi:hypothetical protein
MVNNRRLLRQPTVKSFRDYPSLTGQFNFSTLSSFSGDAKNHAMTNAFFTILWKDLGAAANERKPRLSGLHRGLAAAR